MLQGIWCCRAFTLRFEMGVFCKSFSASFLKALASFRHTHTIIRKVAGMLIPALTTAIITLKYCIQPPVVSHWRIFKETDGALSCCEALCIIQLAAETPEGLAVELGVYKGKSAISAVVGFKNNPQFYLVEPEFKDKEWLREVLYLLNDVCKISNQQVRIKPFDEYSTEVIPLFKNISYCFVDSGSHQDGLPMQEVKLLEDIIIQGGIIAFHDFGNQFREPKGAAEYLVSTGKYEWIDIDWKSIVEYVKENISSSGKQ